MAACGFRNNPAAVQRFLVGKPKSDYKTLHSNNHVNLAQSTNDVYPTAIRLAILLSYGELTQSMENFCYDLKKKSTKGGA